MHHYTLMSLIYYLSFSSLIIQVHAMLGNKVTCLHETLQMCALCDIIEVLIRTVLHQLGVDTMKGHVEEGVTSNGS